jgi:hypothetical protein
MITEASVFVRAALVAALTASLILGVLAITRPVNRVLAQGPYSASN